MSAGAVAVAVVLDAALREPPLPVHPVRLSGRYLHAAARWVPAQPPRRALVCGAAAWTAGAVVAAGTGAVLERTVRHAPAWCRWTVLGVALWPLFAHRLLLDEVTAVEQALGDSLVDGRVAVGRIVSRDVTNLTPAQVRQASIESLAENLSDSVAAPLLWFAVGGLPAATLYRFVNTADAMWGYRTTRWCYAGRVAARADDLMNLAPSRLTGLVLAGPGVSPRRLRAEARKTPSPNAGWPMAAVALRLGVRLGKPGVYELARDGCEPTASDVADALRLVRRRGWALAAGCAVLAGLRRRRLRGWRG